jgi:hypothetical protein
MIARLKARALALPGWQKGVVIGLAFVTVIGAALALWGFSVWNERKSI